MTAKSIIDVEVNDQAFKNFSALFAKYQAQLAKMPAGWNKVNAASAAGTKVIQQTEKDLDLAAAHLKKLDDYQKLLNKHAKDGESSFKAINKSASATLSAVKSTTGLLLKWAGMGGILGGLMGVGGLFGFSGLASSGSDLRRTSLGMGLTPGQLQSAQAHYGKYMDVNAALENINKAQTNVNSGWVLNNLGVSDADRKNKASADLLPELIPKIAEAFRNFHGDRSLLDAKGITQLVDYNTARELSKLSPEELQSTADKYREDAKRMNVPDAKLRALQEFDEQLDASAALIKSTFMEALAPLAPNLQKLSKSVAEAIQAFLKNPNLGKDLESIGEGAKDAAAYLSSNEFRQGVKDFMITLGGIGAGLKALLHPIDSVMQRKQDEANQRMKEWNEEDLRKRNHGMVSGKLRTINPLQTAFDAKAQIAAAEKKYGLPSGFLLAQLTAESKLNPNAKSAKGALGIAQFMPDVAKAGGFDPLNPSASIDQAGAMMKRLRERFGSNEKALAAYNWGEGNVAKYGLGSAPAETRNYMNTVMAGHPDWRITINNNTGGSAVASAAALAHQ